MNAQELFLSSGKSAGVWYCEKCRIVHRERDQAEQCCGVRKCACGKECNPHYTSCDSCMEVREMQRERERFEKSEKLTSWDGPVFCEGYGNDGYHESVESLLDEIEDNRDGDDFVDPEYCWACDKVQFVQASIDDITSRMEGDMPEDFDTHDLNGLPELQAALDAFNEANKDQVSWQINYKKSVLLTEAE